MLATQEPQPSLQEVIHISKQFSPAQRLILAKTLLDSLVSEDLPSGDAENGDIYNHVHDLPDDIVDNTTDEAILRERKAYVELHPTLVEKYPGEHVAIYGGRLIDHDKDGLALSQRVYKQYPDEFVWITPIKEQSIEEWVVRSPRFERVTE